MMVFNNSPAPTRFRDVDIGDVFSYDNNGLWPVSYYIRIEEVRNYNAIDLESGALFTMEDTDIVENYPEATMYMHPIETDDDDEDTIEFYDDGDKGFVVVKHKCEE